MNAAGPGHLNEEASIAYRQLSKEEQEHLRREAGVSVKNLTKKEVLRRGEKIFSKMQLMVSTNACVRLWDLLCSAVTVVCCCCRQSN